MSCTTTRIGQPATLLIGSKSRCVSKGLHAFTFGLIVMLPEANSSASPFRVAWPPYRRRGCRRHRRGSRRSPLGPPRSLRRWPSRRPTTSVLPPGPKGTTSFTGRVGQAGAWPQAGRAAPAPVNRRRRCVSKVDHVILGLSITSRTQARGGFQCSAAMQASMQRPMSLATPLPRTGIMLQRIGTSDALCTARYRGPGRAKARPRDRWLWRLRSPFPAAPALAAPPAPATSRSAPVPLEPDQVQPLAWHLGAAKETPREAFAFYASLFDTI